MFERKRVCRLRNHIRHVLILVAIVGCSPDNFLIRPAAAQQPPASPEPNVVLPSPTPPQPAGAPGSNRLYSQMNWDQVSRVNEPFKDFAGRTVFQLSLQDCIKRAMINNLDIRIGSHGPAIGLSDVVKAEAAFDAVLFGSSRFDFTDRANPQSGYTTKTITTENGTQQIKIPTQPFINTHDYNYSVGLRKRLPTGATIETAETLRRFRTDQSGYFLNPFYEYSLNTELRQPLLRDFGIDLNRANIDAARNSFRISQQQFNLQVIKTITDVETNYWRLVFARQQLKVYQLLYREAEQTLNRLRQRQTLDAGSAVVARNMALIERARANVIASRSNLLQQQDQLLQSLNDPNLPLTTDWEIVPTDQPTTQEYKMNRAEAIQVALAMRPEIISQRLTLDTAGIATGVAENQLLPRLDLIARHELNGAGDGYDSSWNQQWRNETANYSAGISFEIPLGNRAANAALSRTRHEEQQEKLRLDSFREQVRADVSIALTTLDSTVVEIAARLLAAQAEADTLQAYLAQEDTDAAITADFLNLKLDTEERLANAQVTAAQTLFRYNVAIIDAHRAQGTLLRYNNIKLAEQNTLAN